MAWDREAACRDLTSSGRRAGRQPPALPEAKGEPLGCRVRAGQDSMYLAGAVPSTMIFTPCEKGISHNEAENVTPADIEPGTNVLLHAVLARDAV